VPPTLLKTKETFAKLRSNFAKVSLEYAAILVGNIFLNAQSLIDLIEISEMFIGIKTGC
jgi:hypothetical protein